MLWYRDVPEHSWQGCRGQIGYVAALKRSTHNIHILTTVSLASMIHDCVESGRISITADVTLRQIKIVWSRNRLKSSRGVRQRSCESGGALVLLHEIHCKRMVSSMCTHQVSRRAESSEKGNIWLISFKVKTRGGGKEKCLWTVLFASQGGVAQVAVLEYIHMNMYCNSGRGSWSAHVVRFGSICTA